MVRAMGWHKPENFAGSSIRAILVGLFVASGGLLFGYDVGVINGVLVMEVFQDHFSTDRSCRDNDGHVDLCPSDSSLIVGILSLGAVVGSILAAPLGDSIGRRKTLLAAVVTFCIGAIFQVCAQATPMLLVGRALAGVAVGATSVLVPLYQSETAPKWIRGSIICAYQLSITVGILSATIINVITQNINSSAAYRIPLGLQLVPGVILAAGIAMLPETPRFLVKKGRNDDAGISLSRFRRLDITHPALQNELQEIIANHQYELTLGHDTYRDLFTSNSNLGRRTLTGCGLQMLQQLTGINFVMYYGTTFFNTSGVSNPFIINLVMIIVNCVCTIPGLIVIEKLGRRKLLMAGALGQAVCQLIIGAVSTASETSSQDLRSASNMALIVCCAINVFFYATSWGPVTWVVTSEIFPLKVRAKAMSVSTTANWLLNFAVAYAPPFIMGRGADGFGLKIFFIWGTFCILAIVFVWFMVYETSRMTLEQIDEMYERVQHAWESPGFNPSWSFQAMRNTGWSTTEQPTELQNSNTTSSAEDQHSIHSHHPPNSATPIANVDFSY
ncbi:general substrate transporter [Fusarium flagelliforme]|uniref:general substrate transporter n=1 Tax=Fusarium flagelliforme TaxID=2675880 RepID=UPI001E8D65F9|nr:general substrate transporter [Fusarium flagelliforme]KAH7174833.1 general substrate transporter [Fusarium flagelliforme]